MNREWLDYYSNSLQRDTHIMVHGHAGVPLLAIPCQDGMCDNWEGFRMQDTLREYIDSGKIQLFCVDTVDRESWSDEHGDPAHRAWIQECYFHYLADEVVPFIMEKNGSGEQPIIAGFSLGATHAAITFLRRPDLFKGLLGCSGCYDTAYFWHGWSNSVLYDNSPISFLLGMSPDHPWISEYNSRKIALVVGQGAWEDEGRRSLAVLRDVFYAKGINAWVDYWGYDVNHDWDWWRKQILYFLPWLLEKE